MEIEERDSKSYKLLNLVFRTIPTVMAISRIDTGAYFKVTDRFCEVLEFSREEVIGKTVIELGIVRADQRELYIDEFKKNNRIHDLELVIHTKTGKPLTGYFSAGIINYLGVDCILSTFNNITEIKQAERALRESEKRYRDFLNFLPLPVIETDSQGILTFVNVAVKENFGYKKRELLNNFHITNLVIPENRTWLLENLGAVVKGNAFRQHEYTALRKDGTTFPLVTFSRPKYDGDNIVGGTGILIDVTDRKKLDEERLRIQKLDSIALLAGGIAHDFNNLLTGILGNVSLIQIQEDLPEAVVDTLEDVENAAIRASQLTRQLLTFSKGGAPIKKSEDVRKIIEDSVSFVMRGRNSKCETFLPPDLPVIEVDAAQISQVLNNLLINADQAMPEGGTIHLSAETVEIAPKSGSTLTGGSYLRINITDQGKGIPREIRNRIFEPYFTTKKTGTGLGLATSFSIVRRHGGTINFSSGLEGTTFSLLLPIGESISIPEIKQKKTQTRFSGRAMVMDDEPMIQRILGKMLANLGFTVDYANSGEEGMDLLQDARAQGDLFKIAIVLYIGYVSNVSDVLNAISDVLSILMESL